MMRRGSFAAEWRESFAAARWGRPAAEYWESFCRTPYQPELWRYSHCMFRGCTEISLYKTPVIWPAAQGSMVLNGHFRTMLWDHARYIKFCNIALPGCGCHCLDDVQHLLGAAAPLPGGLLQGSYPLWCPVCNLYVCMRAMGLQERPQALRAVQQCTLGVDGSILHLADGAQEPVPQA